MKLSLLLPFLSLSAVFAGRVRQSSMNLPDSNSTLHSQPLQSNPPLRRRSLIVTRESTKPSHQQQSQRSFFTSNFQSVKTYFSKPPKKANYKLFKEIFKQFTHDPMHNLGLLPYLVFFILSRLIPCLVLSHWFFKDVCRDLCWNFKVTSFLIVKPVLMLLCYFVFFVLCESSIN